jgi:CheY-like chemotaxis protein
MNTDANGDQTRCCKVLLVDDEKMVLDVGKAILQRLGHEVLTAMSGEEALEQFEQHRASVGCAVLDLTMPGMNGKETFERLRVLKPELPVIIASGLSVDQVISEFGNMPPTSVIQKPYQVADLSATIQSILTSS